LATGDEIAECGFRIADFKRELECFSNPHSAFRNLTIGSPAADEVDDLDPVALTQRRLGPQRASHDLAVKLDRDPFGRVREQAKEIGDRRPFLDLSLLAVDDDLHAARL
jgi:hypothetical protein